MTTDILRDGMTGMRQKWDEWQRKEKMRWSLRQPNRHILHFILMSLFFLWQHPKTYVHWGWPIPLYQKEIPRMVPLYQCEIPLLVIFYNWKHRAKYPCVRKKHRAKYPCVRIKHRAKYPCVRIKHRAWYHQVSLALPRHVPQCRKEIPRPVPNTAPGAHTWRGVSFW